MSERIESIENKENLSTFPELSNTYCLIFKILLIILIIINIFMLMFFGLNNIILFVVALTLIIRMFIGLHNKRPHYFINSLFLFNMCFACHIIKIIFRYIMTYYTYKKEYDISNIKDVNIIETQSILWIPGFDIKLSGMWTLIILILFMIYWAVLIALFESKREYFNHIDKKEYDEYLDLINKYYKLPRQNNQVPDNNVINLENQQIQNNNEDIKNEQ
jgi:hypothetical protein